MKLKGLLKVALVLLAVSSLFVACDTIAGGRFPRVEKVYMKPGEDWASDKPVYAAWMWTDGKEGSWTELTKSTIEEDLWEVAVPSEIDNIIFVKMKDGTTKDKFSWDAKEEQTGDLKVPYVYDNVQVYSIKAKEWIELGAKESEPEPVTGTVLTDAQIAQITHFAGSMNNWEHSALTEYSFTFYAGEKDEFAITSGEWNSEGDMSNLKLGDAVVTELGVDFPLEKDEDLELPNVTFKKNLLTKDSEYKVTVTVKEDNIAYVKVVATGGTRPLERLSADDLTKVTHIAGTMTKTGDQWGHKPLDSKTYLFAATGSDEFVITDGTWNFKLGSATIEKLGEEYPLFKNGNNIKFKNDVLTESKNYIISVVIRDSVVYVKVDATEKEIEYVEKVYLHLDYSWYNSGNRFAAYFYGDNDFSKWENLTEDTKEGVYYVDVPEDAKNVIYCSMKPDSTENNWDNKVAQTGNLNIPIETDSKIVYSMSNDEWYDYDSIPQVDYSEPVTYATTVYLKPNSNWLTEDARFAAYFFGDNGDTWVGMKDDDQDGVYECIVPEGYPKVIFCRMSPSATENSWDNKWNQTADLSVPTDEKVLCTIAEGEWNGAGSWSTL